MGGNRAGGDLARVEPRHAHRAGRRTQKAVQELGKRGLAGAVLADDSHDLSGIDPHVKVVHGRRAAGIGEADILEAHDGAGVHGMGARRGNVLGAYAERRVTRVVRGACGAVCRRTHQAADETRRLRHREARRRAAHQPVARERVVHARDARAVDAYAPELVRVREHLARRAVQHERALPHHQNAVAVLGKQRHLLLYHHDGDALLAHLAQRVEHEGRGRRVERRRRLVEHENAWAHDENGGNGHFLLLAARERRYLAVPQICNPHRVERPRDAVLDLVVRDAKVLEPEEQLVFDHGRDHLRVDVLQDAADHLRDARQGDVAGVTAVHQRGTEELSAKVMRYRTGQHGGQR